MGTGEKLTRMRHVYYIYNGSHIKRHMLRDQNVPTLITTTAADGSKFLYERKTSFPTYEVLVACHFGIQIENSEKIEVNMSLYAE